MTTKQAASSIPPLILTKGDRVLTFTADVPVWNPGFHVDLSIGGQPFAHWTWDRHPDAIVREFVGGTLQFKTGWLAVDADEVGQLSEWLASVEKAIKQSSKA